MERHPDLGDPEVSFRMQHMMEQAEHERKMREAEEAERLRWNPLGRWTIKTVTNYPDARHRLGPLTNITANITEYLLVDNWEKDTLLKKFTDVYGGKDTINNHTGSIFTTKNDTIRYAEQINKETNLKHKNALNELYIEEVNNAMEAVYNKLHNLRKTVENLKTLIKHTNTLEGDNG